MDYLMIILICGMVIAILIVAKDMKGWEKKFTTIIIGFTVGALMLTVVDLSEKDNKAYKNAATHEIQTFRITKVSPSYINFVYWEGTNKRLRKGEVSWDDVIIGNKVALGVKEDAHYILGDFMGEHEKVKYLKLTEQKLDQLQIDKGL